MRTIEEDPRAALTGLVALAVLGILVIGAALLFDGLAESSAVTVAGALAVTAFPLWAVFRLARTVRRHLTEEATA